MGSQSYQGALAEGAREMLMIYRRHRRACQRRSEGRSYRRCQCPIWVDGILNGQEIRQSLKMCN